MDAVSAARLLPAFPWRTTTKGRHVTATTHARRSATRALALGGAVSLAVMLPGAALAQEGFDGEGSGSATITCDGDGDMADVQVDWEGLAAEIPDLSGTDYEALSGAPFPHAQHIHAGGEGRCPSPDEDTDGDGIINTPEGGPAYGGVVTSLTTGEADTGPGATLDIENFPTGSSADYSRTIDLSVEGAADLVRDGNATIVIHGLDPAIMPGDTALADSAISDDLPLAATAPALCGVLNDNGDGTFTAVLSATNPVAQADEMETDGHDQVTETPSDGIAAGGGSTAGTSLPLGLLTLIAGMLALAAAGVTVASRRSNV